jgi:cell wall-associated NlpC family hydrolase
MMMLEKRLNAFRDDLADQRLKGQVDVKVFREGSLMQLLAPIATLHRAPAVDAPQETQVLFGETLRVFDVTDGWAWVQLQHDHYVGYIRQDFLSATIYNPTHHVTVPTTLLYPKPNIKTQPTKILPMNAQLSVIAKQDQLLELVTGGFVFASHAAPILEKKSDFVEVAQQFLHTPYLWGGKSSHGLDCSGLVQTALHACGVNCPRDADMQEIELGTALRINDLDGLKRGDLVFWDGHVGIMENDTTLLHANGHHMQVTSEPLREVVARTDATGKPVTSIKRL